MKLQGVLRDDVKIDIKKYFTRPDYRAERIAQEMEEHRKLLAREAKTSVGAVKRLI